MSHFWSFLREFWPFLVIFRYVPSEWAHSNSLKHSLKTLTHSVIFLKKSITQNSTQTLTFKMTNTHNSHSTLKKLVARGWVHIEIWNLMGFIKYMVKFQLLKFCAFFSQNETKIPKFCPIIIIFFIFFDKGMSNIQVRGQIYTWNFNYWSFVPF